MSGYVSEGGIVFPHCLCFVTAIYCILGYTALLGADLRHDQMPYYLTELVPYD